MGSELADAPGPDLLGLLIGSEGTLGIATKITVRILRKPEAVQTLLAAFDTIEGGGAAVSDIIGAGIIPAAIEMMDRLAIEAAEAAVHPGFPASDTVLIVELDGPAAEVRGLFGKVEEICRTHGATTIEVARTEAQRARIWKGRKAAFAAMGRVSPNYYVQDGVVPRTRLPEVLNRIRELERRSGLRIGNVFHAGDGNLHPLICYDERVPGQPEQAEAVAAEILGVLRRSGRIAHRRARHRRRQVAVHAAHVQRRGSFADAAGPQRVRSQGPLQSWQGAANASAVRGSAGALSRASRRTRRARRALLMVDPADLIAAGHQLDTRAPDPGARWRGRPPSSARRRCLETAEAVAAALEWAARKRLSVVIRGQGSKLGWGARSAPIDVLLDMSQPEPHPRPPARRSHGDRRSGHPAAGAEPAPCVVRSVACARSAVRRPGDHRWTDRDQRQRPAPPSLRDPS